MKLDKDSFKFLLIAKRKMNPRFVLAKEFAKFCNIPIKEMSSNKQFKKILDDREGIHYKTEKEFRKWLKELLNLVSS